MTKPSTLWADRDFVKLWAAQAISAFGSRITRDGLPLADTTLPLQAAGMPATVSGGAWYMPAGVALRPTCLRRRSTELPDRMTLLIIAASEEFFDAASHTP